MVKARRNQVTILLPGSPIRKKPVVRVQDAMDCLEMDCLETFSSSSPIANGNSMWNPFPGET